MQRLIDKRGLYNDINRLFFYNNSCLSNTIHNFGIYIDNIIFIT